jgi:hypothetical protein
MKRTFSLSSTLALLVALTGCGDDDPTGSTGGDLTEGEAAALAEIVASGLFETFVQNQGPAPAPALVTGTFSIDADIQCEFGGLVAVSGNLAFDIDDQTGDGTLDYTVTQDHQNCVGESDSGQRFTLNGQPNVTSDFLVTLTSDILTFAGDYGGAVAWTTGERSGTCPVDVDFSFTGDATGDSGTATISGSVCNVSFSSTLTVG